MSYLSENNRHAAESVIKRFQKRQMDACYCDTKEEARDKILSLLPKGASVTWGGSESMSQAGVMDALKDGDYRLIDRKSAKTPEEQRDIYGEIVCADYFLTSTNAFTKDGELVNIDGAGNRVACLCFGPSHVIVLAGMNKMCDSVDDAIRRVHLQAAPPNALRVGVDTPCTKTGLCADCVSPQSICCQTVITRMSKIPGRISVILCGESLGF